MSTSKIADIHKVINNPKFIELKEYFSRKSIFAMYGKERDEISHSKFLAFLFNPKAHHNFGDKPLRLLFLLLLSNQQKDKHGNQSDNNSYDISQIYDFLADNYDISDCNVHTEFPCTVSDDNYGRIDIMIELEIKLKSSPNPYKTIILIENKIGSEEHKVKSPNSDYQTIAYYNYITREYKSYKFLCGYLNVNGEEPKSPNFTKITYQEIVDYVIEPLLVTALPYRERMILDEYLRLRDTRKSPWRGATRTAS